MLYICSPAYAVQSQLQYLLVGHESSGMIIVLRSVFSDFYLHHTQVEYRERLSAVGRLPMRPDRRERNGTEREALAGRIIDRAVRPLLPPGFLYDTQAGHRG